MSINMEDPTTLAEKIDAAANLVEQMKLAHTIKDEAHFQRVAQKASDLLFDAMELAEET